MLTRPEDPFKLVVKSYLPGFDAGGRRTSPTRRGARWPRSAPRFKAPGMPQRTGRLRPTDERWFVTDKRLYRVVKKRRARRRFAFQYVDRPELVEDFLNPPKHAGTDGVARFRYRDKAARPGQYDWPLDGQAASRSRCPTAT